MPRGCLRLCVNRSPKFQHGLVGAMRITRSKKAGTLFAQEARKRRLTSGTVLEFSIKPPVTGFWAVSALNFSIACINSATWGIGCAQAQPEKALRHGHHGSWRNLHSKNLGCIGSKL